MEQRKEYIEKIRRKSRGWEGRGSKHEENIRMCKTGISRVFASF